LRAVVYEGPNKLSIEERETPTPKQGEALVKVTANGICGSDIHGYTGETGRRVPGMIMGHEFVGTIADIGPNTEYPEGWHDQSQYAVNPVMSDGICDFCKAGLNHHCRNRLIFGVSPSVVGAFSDYVIAPIQNLISIGDKVDPEWGALVEPMSVGYHAAKRAGIGPGEPLLVIGAGPIGTAVVLAARRLGTGPVIVSEPNPERRDRIAALDVTAIDPINDDLPARVKDLCGDLGAQFVIDAVGSSRTLADSLSLCSPRGTMVLLGMHEPTLSFDSYALSVAERHLVGSFCYTAEEFKETAEWVATAPRELEGFISTRVGYGQISERFALQGKGEDLSLKVVFTPHSDN